LQSVLGNDTIDGSFADVEVTLSKFLGNDFGAGFRIQEPVADDLTNRFLGSTIVRFGTPFGAKESLAALFEEERADLKITLTAKTEFGRCTIDSFGTAFPFDEHGQLEGYLISFGNGEAPRFTLDALLGKLERNHRNSPRLS